MRSGFLVAAAFVAALSSAGARADVFDFSFNGPGVSGSVELSYGTATDARYSNAFVVTGASGAFSDPSIGIPDAQISGVVPRTFATPSPDNLLAPDSFSSFVSAGLPASNHGAISYDDLFWPGGSVPTATDYQAHGGFLDIYGVLLDIGGGRVVNLWSNGDNGSGVDYGVAVVTSAQSLAYVSGGVAVPEAGSLGLLAGALALLGALRQRAVWQVRQ